MEKESVQQDTNADFVAWFSELSNKDVSVAGGKGASLAEMYNAKVPVPPGFVVTAEAYSYFIRETGIGDLIQSVLAKLEVDNTSALHAASNKIREIIENQEIPAAMQEEILESYEVLGVQHEEEKDALTSVEKSEEDFVAVRSSATTEDLADASFAGQQETFLNVHGGEDLLEKVKKCMSSLFTPRAIFYREKKGFDHTQAQLAVVVQKMVDSEKSGVMFSQNPTKNDGRVVIEAVWGLGEGIVSGKIKPDHYEVNGDLEQFKVEQAEVNEKKLAIIKNADGKNEEVELGSEQRMKRVLNNYELKRLAQYARQLEEHYKKPQDIEFAIDESGIYIVQSRPITTVAQESTEEVAGNVLLSGLAASPGVASGPVSIIQSMDDLEKIKKGDVLVTEMTNPDMVVAMQKSAGIVTDEGGITSHAAIVSREMGIPAVVGTGEATKKLADGDVITVDGSHGKVIEGKGETKLVVIEPIVPTKTEIKVIVDLPLAAERAAKSCAQRIGLTRLESIIATGGKHPLQFVHESSMDSYKKLIADGISGIITHFEGMWIRTSDLRSDEYRELEGAPQEVEGNPMLGDHGIRFSLKHEMILKTELAAIKEVAERFPEKKFGIMTPQIISVDEVRATKALAEAIGIPKNLEIGIMVETPAAVQIIEELCQEGISFISFGTNDLTQYTLAIDRNNEEVQNLFDETHPAVVRSIQHVIAICKKNGVQTSICGQAGSRPEMAKILVEAGIGSISVNADAARKISEVVAKVEEEFGVRKVESREVQSVSEQVEEDSEEERSSSGKVVDNQMKKGALFEDKDIEEVALAALGEEDYNPGALEKKEDIPSLNDAFEPASDER